MTKLIQTIGSNFFFFGRVSDKYIYLKKINMVKWNVMYLNSSHLCAEIAHHLEIESELIEKDTF